ncbi:MAG: DNA topoisomerase IB [Betaproteobacteria bacterium]|nr:MAG: DNA topoisomerase IB [Betaproteobacteria bacterium]
MVRNTTNTWGAASASDVVAEAVEMAAAAGLVYVSDAEPGIRRERNGEQFIYFRPNRRRMTKAGELERIARLAIPPAYDDVWICMHPRGHLQATGRDARRRKQYRYHPEWRTIRDGAKFGSMAEFGEALSRLRARVRRDLAQPGLPRDKVLAVVVSLLDRFIRAGRLLFRFRGKGGAEHEVVVDDERLARIVRRCQQLPGQQLFQYVDDAGQRRGIDSGQVNEYLRDAMGADFTAKDFRTWSATVRAIALLRATPLPEERSERALNACIVAVVKTIAAELRNTPAVCRKSYINPCVFEAWRSGELHAAIGTDGSIAPRKAERLALAFLQQRAAARSGPTQRRIPVRRPGAASADLRGPGAAAVANPTTPLPRHP